MNPSNIYPRTGDTQTVYLNQVVTRAVPPYTIVGGMPATPIRKRFSEYRRVDEAVLVGLAGETGPGQFECHPIGTAGSNQMTCFSASPESSMD